MSLLGIDLGTSSLKVLLVDDVGRSLVCFSEEYDIDTPVPGWAEQHPSVWWNAAKRTIGRVVSASGIDPTEIKGVGLSGQMHGTVLLDRGGDVLRPSIIWCDQRSGEQCDRIGDKIGEAGLRQVCNRISTGFMAPSLVWIKENEPETFERIDKVLLPKDYLMLKLTGEASTDVSDASATLLFDIRGRQWSDGICASLDLPVDILPAVHDSTDVIGSISGEAARETGLSEGIPVVAGGGDTPVMALANGVISPGSILCSIGTGGLLFAPTSRPIVDPEYRTNTFCHCLERTYYIMGAILAGGLSLRWLRDNLLGGDYQTLSDEAQEAPPGSDGLVFLPYLIGERTPHMDPHARGAFIGLALSHTRAHVIRAVMEGVTFALRDCLEILRSRGLGARRIVISGGAASSPLWRQIQADVFNTEVVAVANREQSAFGAALLAGMGIGLYGSADEACARVAGTASLTQPIQENARLYEESYAVYRSLYPGLKDRMSSPRRLFRA